MSDAIKTVKRWARRVLRGVREWCGDAAYDQYLLAEKKQGASRPVLTAEEFYLEQLHRKYSRPTRCC